MQISTHLEVSSGILASHGCCGCHKILVQKLDKLPISRNHLLEPEKKNRKNQVTIITNSSNVRVDRASAFATVDSGLIPSRVKAMTIKSV